MLLHAKFPKHSHSGKVHFFENIFKEKKQFRIFGRTLTFCVLLSFQSSLEKKKKDFLSALQKRKQKRAESGVSSFSSSFLGGNLEK